MCFWLMSQRWLITGRWNLLGHEGDFELRGGFKKVGAYPTSLIWLSTDGSAVGLTRTNVNTSECPLSEAKTDGLFLSHSTQVRAARCKKKKNLLHYFQLRQSLVPLRLGEWGSLKWLWRGLWHGPWLVRDSGPSVLPDHTSHSYIMKQNSSCACHLTQALLGHEVYNDIRPKNGHANVSPNNYHT